MQRNTIAPRRDWKTTVEGQGLLFHTAEGVPYWDESAYYGFSLDEINRIEAAANVLQRLCLLAGERIIAEGQKMQRERSRRHLK